jgi:hypothetical protein
MNDRYYLVSGETLEDYFRRLNLVETRRKYLESIKQGKQWDREIQESSGNGDQHLLIAQGRYSMYMKRFMIRRHRNPMTQQLDMEPPLTIHKKNVDGLANISFCLCIVPPT